jgi:hypothetical protein
MLGLGLSIVRNPPPGGPNATVAIEFITEDSGASPTVIITEDSANIVTEDSP